MFIVEEIWNHIKSFLIHNINVHGKHLQNDPYIKTYNIVVDNLPNFRPFDRGSGPYIIYSSFTKKIRFVKFVYTVKHKNIRKLIMTYMLYKPIFGIGGGAQHEIIYQEYYDYSNKSLKQL